jgi:hypothetical protein
LELFFIKTLRLAHGQRVGTNVVTRVGFIS